MDEFDFDEDAPASASSASVAASSSIHSPTSQTPHDAAPSHHPPPSSSSSLSACGSTPSSPARGRTKARRSRKVIRTGQEAKLAAVERFSSATDAATESCTGGEESNNVGSKRRSDDALDTPSSRGNDNSSSNSSSSSLRIYGRRRKKQKSAGKDGTSSIQDYSIDTLTDRDYKILPIDSNSNATPSYFQSSTPPSSSSRLNKANSKSVRFSLSSNEHYYGTPPSSQWKGSSISTPPETTVSEEDRQTNGGRIEIRSSQSQSSVNDSISESSSSSIHHENNNIVMRSEDKGRKEQDEPVARKREHDMNSKKSSSPTKSDHSASSYGSFRRKRKYGGCYAANNSIINNHTTMINNSNNTGSDDSQKHYTNDDNEMYYSNSPKTTTIALGQRDDIQDMGNYRMMIDDLSYLCSAILGCKKRVPVPTTARATAATATTTAAMHSAAKKSTDGRSENTKMMEKGHTAITAGAACDLAQMISQSEIQVAMLILMGRGNQQHRNVGALSAVLEAVACAPPEGVDDATMEVCKGVVTMGRSGAGDTATTDLKCNGVLLENNGVNDEKLKEVLLEKQPAATIIGGRTKNARRKQHVSSNGNATLNSKEAAAYTAATTSQTLLIHRDKYHEDISSKALAIVAHVVSVICTSKHLRNNNPQIDKSAIKSARNVVLGHKAALQGISRLVLNDPVVDAYLRQEDVSSIHHGGTEVVLDVNVTAINNPTKDSCADNNSSVISEMSRSKVGSADASSFDMELESGCKTADPTKFGRQKGRKKKPSRLPQVLASSSTHLEPIYENDGGDTEDWFFGDLSYTTNKTAEPHKIWGCGSDKVDSFSFASTDGTPSTVVDITNGSTDPVAEIKRDTKYQKKIDSALSNAKVNHLVDKISQLPHINTSQENAIETCPFCATWEQQLLKKSDDDEHSSFSLLTPASLALDAADRVVSGRDTSNSSEEDINKEQHSDEDENNEFLATDEADDMSNNPILFANEMIRKSGSLLNYSKSMATTVIALLLVYGCDTKEQKRKGKNCLKCITYLQHRASMLSVIIDNLCCLSPKVSRELSVPESYLIPSLLQTVSRFHEKITATLSPVLEDSLMNSLKTLTTLTHENPLACEQVIKFSQSIHDDGKITNGVEIVFDCLLKTVMERPDHKFAYDTTISCLNILTNTAEMMPALTRVIFDDLVVDDQKNGMTWLTQWLVSKTANFMQAVMKGSFGSTANTKPLDEQNDSELQSGEESNLVTAGNGFILLSYLMLDENNGSVTSKIRDNIINNLPLDETGNSGGIQYMIKTLKAFCNFYHYSVGDLSVAVIAPVIKLISGLERLCLSHQGGNWL